MRLGTWIVGLLALACLPPISCAAHLTKVERRLLKEPTYQTKPKYALAVFGPEAHQKVWLVVDGDTLLVDRNGNGDLTEPGEKVAGKDVQYQGFTFKVGDIVVNDRTYADLEVLLPKVKDYEETYRHVPAVQELLKANPEAVGYSVYVDVPLDRPLKDDKGRSVTALRHFVSMLDANGVLQFADKPADAPILHFGGAWHIWPREGQKFVLGRPEEFTTYIGTPGLGPGTLAIILYHTLGENAASFVPRDTRPVLHVRFRGNDGESPPTRIELTDRC